MFEVKVDEFGEAATMMEQTTQDVNVTAARTGQINLSFLQSNDGFWSQAAGQQGTLLENNLHIFFEALSTFSTRLEMAWSNMQREMQPKRDALVAVVGASPADANRLSWTMTDYTPCCVNLSSSLESLQTATTQAQNALSGLEDSGDIASALNSLQSTLTAQIEKAEELNTKIGDYQESIEYFERVYSGIFDKEFITERMITDARAAMLATYEKSGIAQTRAFHDFIRGTQLVGDTDTKHWYTNFVTFGMNGAKAWMSFAGKGLAELGEKNGLFTKGLSGFKSDFFKKLGENFGLFDMSGGQAKKAFGQITKGLAFDKKLADLNKRFGNYDGMLKAAGSNSAKLANFGSKIKAGGRVLGWVGDAMEVFKIGSDATQAYMTEVGDESDKTAAAAVSVIGGTGKFVAGKVVGAAIGAAVGGPVGAALGMVAGEAASALIDQFAKSDTGKAIADGAKNLISGAIDFFTGNKKSAFA